VRGALELAQNHMIIRPFLCFLVSFFLQNVLIFLVDGSLATYIPSFIFQLFLPQIDAIFFSQGMPAECCTLKRSAVPHAVDHTKSSSHSYSGKLVKKSSRTFAKDSDHPYLNSSEDLMGAMLLKMLHYLPKGRLLTVCLVANQ
jgi:hypothetical protein